jgi:pimeloyl-ACP methyl ester carboxylesterase
MDDAKTISLEANGLRFTAYERGEGPLVLCLHGFPDDARSFRHQMGPLAAAGYRVVAPYMRGYAPTEIPADGRYQTAALAKDVLALIDALGEEKAVLLGHDWGALASYVAAANVPDKVAKLITMAIPYGPKFLNDYMSSYAQLKRSWYVYFFQIPMAEMAVAADDHRFIRNLWKDWSPDWTCPEHDMRLLLETLAKPGVIEAALGYYRCMFDPERQDPALSEWQMSFSVAPIVVPTLAFHGTHDGCMGVDLVAGMETMFTAGLEQVMVDGAGHFLHLEKPEQVNAAILRFLER